MEMTKGDLATGPFLYLPIEVAARELDSRLLLAYFAVAMGFEVVVGQKWLMQRNIDRMPPGIMLCKTLTARDAKVMARARALGYRTTAIDEEMPGVVARGDNMRWVDEHAADQAELIFAVGQEHLHALLARFPQHRDKCLSTGNPRFDLLRPEFRGIYGEDVAEFRREFGRYLLINTNSGFINSGKGTVDQVVRKLERGGKFDRRQPADSAYLQQQLQLERTNFEGLQAVLKELPGRFPAHSIVLRPHPNELEATWTHICAGLPRVHVTRRGTAVPWILGADVLIHTYCTTGIEAFALGKPAVSFQPIDSPLLAKYLSTRVNFVAKTVGDLLARVESLVEADGANFAYPSELHATFAEYFAAQTGSFSAERIVGEISRRFRVHLDSDAPCAAWRPGRRFLRRIRGNAHKIIRLMPEIGVETIHHKLRCFERELSHGRGQRLQAQCLGDRLFHIHGHAEGASIAEPPGHTPWLPRWVRQLAHLERCN